MSGEGAFTGTRAEWWELVAKNKDAEIKKLESKIDDVE